MVTAALWISEAVKTLSLSGEVRCLEELERSEVLNRVAGEFLDRPDVWFWWEHLKVPHEAWQTEQGFRYLTELVADPTEKCWFIAGLTDWDSEKGIFECTPIQACALLTESPAFEYAIVDRKLKWIVIENHHDFLIAAGDAAPRLSQLRG